MRLSLNFIFCAAALLFHCNPATAAIMVLELDGNTSTDVWGDGYLTFANHAGYGGFPGSGAWPAPIASQNTDGDAVLAKISDAASISPDVPPAGGPYPASGSIYFGSFSGAINAHGGTLAVQDATPLVGLANLILQVDFGEASGYDFYNDVFPELTIVHSGGTAVVALTDSLLIEALFTGTVTMPTGEEPVYRNTWGFQWDLSGYSDITDISIEFSGVQHAQLYALSLDQSDVFESGALASLAPEPSHGLLCLVGLGTLMMRRRRSQK